MSILTPDNIRLFLRDNNANNMLIDSVEFSDAELENYRTIALQMFNIMPPLSGFEVGSLPANTEVIVLYGTLANAFAGRAALAARNQMSYSDGGLTIPIEERYQYYMEMSANYARMFDSMSRSWKIGTNMDSESSWGSVGSDFASMPQW